MKRCIRNGFLVLAISLLVTVTASSSALAGVTVYLNTIKPVAKSNSFTYLSGPAKINGESYSSSLYSELDWIADGYMQHWVEYDTGRRYDNFHAVVGIDDKAPDSETEAQFRVFGDGELLYESPLKKLGDEPSIVDVPIKNVLRLKIVSVRSNGSALRYAIWGNPYLTGPKVIEMTIGEAKYRSNDTELELDVAPYVKASRTYLPVRYVAEALGAEVSWNQNTKTVTVVGANGTTLSLTIGSKTMRKDGGNIQMDVAPEIKSSRTMLPIRWVAEALGATVEWNQEAKLVTITLP